MKKINGMTAIETLLMLHEKDREEEQNEGKRKDFNKDKLSDIRTGRPAESQRTEKTT